jgi:nucleoside-diphosphate-sugar epimerase
MIKNGRCPIVGDDHNRRSMGYVDSLAYGISLAAEAPQAAGKIYWLADERPYPNRSRRSPVESQSVHLPGIISDSARLGDWLLQKAGFYNQEIHVLSEMYLTTACSIERAQRELGYKPLVDLREGMRRSVAWCLERAIAI